MLDPPLVSDLDAQLVLEIALRQRLANSLQSRIEWASILHETLQKEKKNSQDSPPNDTLAALSITESSSECILAREPPPPPPSHQKNIRPPRRINLPPTKSKSFLYTRSSALSLGTKGRDNIYRLQCPQCLRISFSSLQGLLNHARLAHNLEWGTHDECIRACAVPGNETDVEDGVEVGLGPTGVLPGLRTIFQMAVGAHNFQEEPDGELIMTTSNSRTPSMAPHLTQTLGLHEDSATLAPYLGKQAIRREIRVWDEDNEVDIEASIQSDPQIDSKPKCHWKMAFTQRNSVTSDSDSDMGFVGNGTQTLDTTLQETEILSSYPEPRLIPKLSFTPAISTNICQKLPSNQSRFYFGTRIIVTDRSLWIPPEQRTDQNENHTHKWMISVDSPSYTYHITSTLDSLTVTPLISGMSTLPIASEPPFVVVGTSDRPFLARVELSFASSGNFMDQKVVLEHWVELDPLTHSVAQGQDQVVDIELDKGTMLKPIQSGYTPIGAKSLWDRAGDSRRNPERPVKIEPQKCSLQTPSANSYETILMSILPKFPMTQKDARNCSSLYYNYKLVSSPVHFKTLVTGRRKAIEWGRARAIQDAYSRIIEQMIPGGDVIPLTVGDVYFWLSDNGHFPVVLEDQNEQRETKHDEYHPFIPKDKASDRWCLICGLDVTAHPWEAGQDTDIIRKPPSEGLLWPKSVGRYHFVPRKLQTTCLPVFDIRCVISGQSEHVHFPTVKYGPYLAKALVAVGDPLLTASISRMVNALGHKHFKPVDMTFNEIAGHRKADIERNLAPFALLAVMARLLIRLLVERGLEAVARDKRNEAGLSSKFQTNRDGSLSSGVTSMLTPRHILSGILSCGRESDNVLWCLARLGVGVCKDEEMRIKMEE